MSDYRQLVKKLPQTPNKIPFSKTERTIQVWTKTSQVLVVCVFCGHTELVEVTIEIPYKLNRCIPMDNRPSEVSLNCKTSTWLHHACKSKKF